MNREQRRQLIDALMEKVHASAVGVLGELRSTDGASPGVSRAPDFYERRTLGQAARQLERLSAQWESIPHDSEHRFQQYSVLDQWLCLLGRCQGLVLARDERDSWRCALDDAVAAMVFWWLERDLPQTLDVPRLPAPSLSVNLISLPEVEHENVVEILLWAATIVELPSKTEDLTALAPLAGGALVAPVLAHCRNLPSWDYVVLSRYDRQLSWLEREAVMSWSRLTPNTPVFIVDDNIGTGATLDAVADQARKAGLLVTGSAAVQSHWRKVRRRQTREPHCAVFDVANRERLSPFTYLHYLDRRELTRRWPQYPHTPSLIDHLYDSQLVLQCVLGSAGKEERRIVRSLISSLEKLLAIKLRASA